MQNRLLFTYEYTVRTYNTEIITKNRYGEPIETTELTWDTETRSRLKKQKRVRAEDHSMETHYTYDNWGNVTYTKELTKDGDRVTDVRTYMYYDKTDSEPFESVTWEISGADGTSDRPIHNLLLGQKTINLLPDIAHEKSLETGDTVISRSFYLYNKYGQRTHEAHWTGKGDYTAIDNTDYIITRYEYYTPEEDSFIRLKRITNPEGHITRFSYTDKGDYYLMTKTEKDVENIVPDTFTEPAPDTVYKSDITTVTAIEMISGYKLWEKNPRGYTTEYLNDGLGRTCRIIKPDDNDVPGWDPTQGARPNGSNNPVTRIQFNDKDLWTRIKGPEGQATTYDYDNRGRLIEIDKTNRTKDRQGNDITEHIITAIRYDGWNNIIAIRDPNHDPDSPWGPGPDDPFSTGDPSGEPDPYTTWYCYDDMGRMNRIVYPPEPIADGETVTTKQPEKLMIFDYETNTLKTIDERGNITEDSYDMKDRLIHRRQEVGESVIETYTWYDGLGNDVVVIDGNGNRTDKLFNALNQNTHVFTQAETFYEKLAGVYTETELTPCMAFEYDKAGYKTKDILRTDGTTGFTDIGTEYKVNGLGMVYEIKNEYTDYSQGHEIPGDKGSRSTHILRPERQ
jgi:YD repeat-containing protein